MNYKENGKDLQRDKKAIIRNPNYYFMESLTWTDLTSGKFSVRYNKCGFVHDVAGPCMFGLNSEIFYIIGLLNSNVANELLSIIAPTLHYNIGEVSNLPIVIDDGDRELIEVKTEENIRISKKEWDSFEETWDFKKHPLI